MKNRPILALAALTLTLNACGTNPQGTSELTDSSRSRSQLVWTCDGLSDPDFANIELYSKGDQLYARVYEESGDGDHGAINYVPMKRTAHSANDHYRYEQAGSARIWNGGSAAGKTQKLVLDIKVETREGRRLDGAATAAFAKAPTGTTNVTYDLTCANYTYSEVTAEVDMRAFADTSVDMRTKDVAMIKVPFAGGMPAVSFTDNGQCLDLKVWSIEKRSNHVAIRVEPDFNLDDGLNSCLVRITQPDGRSATLDLFIDIND